MKPGLQAKLLRVLQDRRFERIGGTRTLEVDVRWIAATNRDVEDLLASGQFREDLYHRLAVFPVRLPPLRERRQDILPLAEILLANISADIGRGRMTLSDDARQLISGAQWTGNVRELGNALERAAILADGEEIRPEHLELREARAPSRSASGPVGAPITLDEIEQRAIEEALASVGGNRRAAADRLGIGLRTLYDKLRKYRGEDVPPP
jgi:two-component system response regulator FlrC